MKIFSVWILWAVWATVSSKRSDVELVYRPPGFAKYLTTSLVKTETKTEVVISTTHHIGICAKLVNVTGPCRLHRGLWVDDPIVMTFDDEVDIVDTYLKPTPTLSVEPTTASAVDINQGRTLNKRLVSPSSYVIQPSRDHDDEDLHEADDDTTSDEESQRLFPRRKFFRFYPLVTLVSTSTTTKTVTVVLTLTPKSKVFFVQKCTPSPFPFKICEKKKHH